ncbi:penicillin-binding protein 1C [Reinekea thalattae]|uniref:peptidoglycan glycosyltransferase n=1 Tax=Reinekea thalattae TaxID=2593301 RepID=A0A5C8Z9Z3_9GAMM|nr:penicillin-binding protein 1C [Reinekea thalattae]TXR53981.1 penicillin-binding protein 1C [Reinekea thalattae]
MKFVVHKKLLTSIALVIFFAITLFAVLLAVVPVPLAKLNAPQASRFYDRNGELLQVIISDDHFYRLSVDIEELPPLLIEALLLQEDQYFYLHPGVNPIAIGRATLSNAISGQVVSGASTITMQLARMLDRRPRTLSAKLLEMFRAIQLELRYSKQEILESYLSIAPYGGNLEGLNAATYAYFGKPAKQLSVAQIALLVTLPKSPNRTRPDRHPEYAKQQRDALLEKMLAAELIDQASFALAIDEPVIKQRLSFPQKIPHLAWYLKSQNPTQDDFYTTVDYNIQSRSQAIVQQYLESLYQQGISNAAVVVMDTKTHEVRSFLGSADYFDQQHEGANNGATALRSPGSTLKPFLYGLAMDEGLIAEKTQLPDIPMTVAGYSPQNYSKSFRGQVTVREALVDSLNVVAVRLSNQLGINKLYQLLKQGGISSMDKPASYYGLPLILGGVEVNLLEMTNLYASLANYGQYQPYRFNSQQPVDTTQEYAKFLSDEASWLISDILTDVERPDFPSTWQYSSSRPTVAWKTGTSYGHQDAWSIGYHPEFTVGVWVGNFNGKPATGLSGNTAAAPLFFDIMQAIVQQPTDWFAKPAGIAERKVCELCGLPGNSFCENNTIEQYIPAVKGYVNYETCQVRQPVATEEGVRLVDVWPSELAAFFHLHGLPVTDAPAYNVSNMAGATYYPPVIQSPVAGAQYIRRYEGLASDDQQIKLQVAVTNRVKQVQWFMDGKLLVTTDKPYEPIFISPPPGRYQLMVIDDTGGSDSVWLDVEDYRKLLPENVSQ